MRELNGQECKQWDQARADKQQIYSTRSMGERITEYESLLQALSKHVGIAAAKVRAQGSCCHSMLIFASNSPYDEQPVSFKSLIHFPCPTNSTVELTQAMIAAAPKLFRIGVKYYKIGVGLISLAPAHNPQFDMFNAPKANPALMETLDEINLRYGRDTLFLAAQGINQKWEMRREYLTPQYTTKWSCIPRVKC